MRIGIIGTGNVGSALAKGFIKGRHEVRMGSRHPDKAKIPAGLTVSEPLVIVKWSELVALAVPYSAKEEVIRSVGSETFNDKILLDVTNAITPGFDLAIGFSTSGAEEIAKLVPKAKVVKAFNTVFAPNQSVGSVGGQKLTLFVASDDRISKDTVMRLGEEIGFESVDAGPLKAARYLEPMAVELMKLAFDNKMGVSIGYRLVRGK